MRNLLFFFCLLSFSCAQVLSQSAPTMFRFGVTHNGFVAQARDLVYDTRAWRFDAGSPVRSTALLNIGNAYFGTAKGIFFALQQKTGQLKWKFSTGEAIHSSAACKDGRIYFSDNGQTLYCLKESNGELIWKKKLGTPRSYPWRFDYYYSSPVLFDNRIYIGSDDGKLYVLNAADGKTAWTFDTPGLVRSTPAIADGHVFFGDTGGTFYCLDLRQGKKVWTFNVICQPLNLDTIGFDRKAILGAPVIADHSIIFGARDGYLYSLDIATGKTNWTVDHEVSWIISTVAVRDSLLVTGTSDGRFIQAVNVYTGKEVWKLHTQQANWSSPLIVNDKVYEGSYDGQLFCLDLHTGRRISQYLTDEMILSSPVVSDPLLFIGSDDGFLYALRGHAPVQQNALQRFVYYDALQPKIYFRNGGDTRIKNDLQNNGYTAIGTDTFAGVMQNPADKVIVFATDFFPGSITTGGTASVLRRFLEGGGRIVIAGNNPLIGHSVVCSRDFPITMAKRSAYTIAGCANENSRVATLKLNNLVI
jgi:eukaryotic-like serine/threonine-protein kinase